MTQPTPQQIAQRSHWPRRLPQTLEVPQTSLWFNLEVSARRYPDKPATIYCGRTMSYGQLHAQALALAGWLQGAGVQAGDRVAIFLQNCPQFLIAFYAINRANAVVVPVNPMNKAEEFGHYISDPATRVVICSADLAGIVAQANEAQPADGRLSALLVTRYAEDVPADAGLPEPMRQWVMADPALPAGAVRWAEALAAGRQPGPHTAGPDDMALLPYTSGTTGLPKGCIHTNRTLMSNCVGGGMWGHASAESVGLAVVPMFHITGMLYGVLGPVYLGMTLVILPRWDRELAGASISRHRVTHWTCIPTMIIDLFGSPNFKSFDLGRLKNLNGGGGGDAAGGGRTAEAGIRPDLLRRLWPDRDRRAFARQPARAGQVAVPGHSDLRRRFARHRAGHAGRDADRRGRRDRHPRPDGVQGLLAAAGSDGGGLHRAGRQAILPHRRPRPHGRGRLLLHHRPAQADDQRQRLQGLALRGGDAALQAPAIQEACIIAARDAYRGETVKAVVVLRAEARGRTTADDIIGWAREHMAAYKVPRLIEFADSLPKSGSGKVMWRLLQEKESEA